LAGPSVELYRDLKTQFDKLDIIASGGVRDISHIQQLIEIGVSGVIVGKAIYEGTLELEKTLDLC
jgi:phosphoribosylformimino-5-aminoimidazole carboxamide ribotide isomerase